MTGIWSLGSEMLRNVESFWCPIRFYSDKKCENCAIDFPDINGGWVQADGNMADVVKLIETKQADGNSAWFGHPNRVTIEGQPQNPARVTTICPNPIPSQGMRHNRLVSAAHDS